MKAYKRMRVPKGLTMGTAAAVALAWAPYALSPGTGWWAPAVQTTMFLALFAVTVRSRRLKIAVVRFAQRWVINPLVGALFAIGLNPLGLAILETRGRVSREPRRTPVGNGRVGESMWIIAEHGAQANYVRNIQHDPRVRVRLRRGLRYQWVAGLATVLPDDDALARQRRIIRWHPLRALNAMNVRVLGADLLTVHVHLLPRDAVSGQEDPRSPDLRPTRPSTGGRAGRRPDRSAEREPGGPVVAGFTC